MCLILRSIKKTIIKYYLKEVNPDKSSKKEEEIKTAPNGTHSWRHPFPEVRRVPKTQPASASQSERAGRVRSRCGTSAFSCREHHVSDPRLHVLARATVRI